MTRWLALMLLAAGVALGQSVTPFSNEVSASWGPCPAGDPSVTSFTAADADSITHDESVILVGCNFGDKTGGAPNTAAPIMWDDFESGVEGADFTDASGWDVCTRYPQAGYDCDYPDPDGAGPLLKSNYAPPVYSSVAAHSGDLGMWGYFPDASANGAHITTVEALLYGDFSEGVFIDGWYQYTYTDFPSRNNKYALIAGDGYSNLNPQMHWANWCNLNASIVLDYRSGGGGVPLNDTMVWDMGQEPNLHSSDGVMRHMQIWTTPSTPGGDDGYVATSISTNTTHITFERADIGNYATGGGEWNRVNMGYYHGKDENASCVSSGDDHYYWDDVYIDNTRARVEIGDKGWYDNCTHREIQIPTYWAQDGDSISFTANKGSFTVTDSIYIFVTHPDGSRNNSGFGTVVGGVE